MSLKCIFIFFILFSRSLFAAELILVGQIPGQYLKKDFYNKSVQYSDSESVLGFVAMDQRIITEIRSIQGLDYREVLSALHDRSAKVIELKKSPLDFDIIYPGLIDLHGHNKQNMLPTWTWAQGRFANRYEWRFSSEEYKQVQSQNMNPWSRNLLGEVAAYRWSELQAMVLGTTYLQGHKLYDQNFTIHSVEDPSAFISQKDRVRSVGDIIDPFKWSFLWNTLRPIMNELGCQNSFQCYKDSLKHFFNTQCVVRPMGRSETQAEIQSENFQPSLPQYVVDQVDDEISIQWLLEAKSVLPDACKVQNVKELLFFVSKSSGNLPHTEIVERNAYLDQAHASAIITHISEGTSFDPATWLEFKLLKLAGLAREGMNIIHGNALEKEDFEFMADNNMGLVWSPYSNFLLYGETVDINEAFKSGVLIALGSDWTPTGSKSVLEELKVAADYIDNFSIKISDADLFDMVTQNPAKIIKHFGYENSQERGVGTLEEGSMATVIVVSEQHKNPHTNLVRYAQAQDINLVVIDGEPLYGNRSFMEDFDSQKESELVSGRLFDLTLKNNPSAFPSTFDRDELDELGMGVAEFASQIQLGYSTQCQFKEDKILFKKESKDYQNILFDLDQKTGINLDTFDGITRFIGVALLSQSHNVTFNGKNIQQAPYAIDRMPPLFSCEDETYLTALTSMVNPNHKNTFDRQKMNREENRKESLLVTSMTLLEDPTQRSIEYSIPYELGVLYQFLPGLEEPFPFDQFEPIIDVRVEQDWLDQF